MNDQFILEMENIRKSFPGVQALKNAQLKVRRGTVHTLMGENGAGKSTLVKILVGFYHMDHGRIVFDGQEVNVKNGNSALHLGISMIFQELNPIPNMTVKENIFIGREPRLGKTPLIDKKMLIKNTMNLFKKFEIDDFSPNDKMSDLSVAKTQMVEICKAISYNSKLIIMDEPTSALSEKECEHLFKIVRNLKKEGVSFIFISHKMDEVFKISDDITVFRDGEYICTEPIANMTKHKLIELMVGRQITDVFPKEYSVIGETALELRNLTKKGLFADVSFDAKKGEILGIAGLMGAGRTELMESVFGYRKLDSGEVYVNKLKVKIKTPRDAIRSKMALICEDRKSKGLFLPLNVRDNMIMASLGSFKSGFFLDKKKITKVCLESIERFNIKTPSLNQIINNLSGGNQQKVLVSRWLINEPDIIILDEPTRGIDVGAKVEIYKFISSLARQGKCIIMISSELPEILGMSDRIVVMHEGRVTGILDRSQATQETIMNHAMGIA
ncbi:sugar ABC transporter ATP-binding protein [Desulfosporosinus fructosivorans]